MHRGHVFTVHRNELTRGYEVACDGVRLGGKSWSWIGSGAVDAVIELDGQRASVRVRLRLKRCTIIVDGNPLEVTNE